MSDIIRPEIVENLERQNDLIFTDFHSFHEIIEKVVDYLKVSEFDISKEDFNKNHLIDSLKGFKFLQLQNNVIKNSSFPNELISYLMNSDLNALLKRDEFLVRKITEVKLPDDPQIIFFDIETSGPGKRGALDPQKNKIELIQLNINGDIILCTPRGCSSDDLTIFAKDLFRHYIVGHNLLFDNSTFYRKTGKLPTYVFDTLQAEILINMATKGRNYHSVFKNTGYGFVTKKYCNIRLDKSNQTSDWSSNWTKSQLRYAKKDVEYLPEILQSQIKQLNEIDSSLAEDKFGVKNAIARLEMKCLLSLFKLRVNGIPVNRPFIEKRRYDSYIEENQIKKKLQNLFPFVDNYNSGPQMLAACERKGISMPNYQRTTISKYADQYEEVAIIEKFKKATQIQKNLKKYKGDIVYPEWVLIGSPPGRMATKKPPVQNIPRAIKEDFYDPRINLIRADYPAIELRICAQYVGEKSMIEAFNQDKDLHKLTASLVVGKPVEKITKEERQLAKAMNYGLIYGMGAKRFMLNSKDMFGLKMTLEEAMKYKESFYRAYPKIHQWHNAVGRELLNGGITVKTLMGRKIWYPEDDYNNALNAPIQGTGADIFKLAVTALEKELEQFSTAKILTLIHDEIIVDAGEENLEKVGESLKYAMEKAAKILMPDIITPIDVEYFPAEELKDYKLPEIKEKVSKLKKTQLNLIN
jgi:DNA polymerase-1